MSGTNGVILTTQGRNLLAKCLKGQPLIFTRAFCGDGNLGSSNPANLKDLISPKKELPIQSINTLQGVGTCEIVLEMSNQGVSQGFFLREYGVFALDQESQQEVLYAYKNSGDESGYLEGYNGIDFIEYTFSIVTVMDQAPNISAILTNSNQYVTITRLDTRINDLFRDYTAPTGFWAFSGQDNQILRPSTLAQTRKALWGDVDVLSFNSRIERLEDAMNQAMLNLELLQEYPGYSHFSAEDFKDVNQIDLFTAAVTSIVAGDDSIDVEPIDGMLPGSLYTLTDGLNTEIVQVQSINLENGIQRVILTEPVKNTYILGSTQIYRTSSRIDDQTALGPNARIKLVWEPELEWRGTGASETFSVGLNTSINNQAAFTFSDNATINSSGYACLS